MLQAIRIVLQRDSEGPEVAYLQTLLKILGYPTNSIDGIFGFNTESQVKSFQADNNLIIDGVVGTKTWQALEERIARLSLPTGLKIPILNITLPYWAIVLIGVGGIVAIIEVVRLVKAKK